MKRRCWFCRYRKEFTIKIWWRGKWRKACPTCQIRHRRGSLGDPK